VFLSSLASILNACAKGNPARPGSDAACPAGFQEQACRLPRRSLQAGRQEKPPGRQEEARRPGWKSLQARCGRKICFSPRPPLSLTEDWVMLGIWRYRDNGSGLGYRWYIIERHQGGSSSSYHITKIHTLSFPVLRSNARFHRSMQCVWILTAG